MEEGTECMGGQTWQSHLLLETCVIYPSGLWGYTTSLPSRGQQGSTEDLSFPLWQGFCSGNCTDSLRGLLSGHT